MAKDKARKGGAASGNADAAGSDQSGQSAAAERIPAALREFGEKAVELANNPIARSMIAAGLVTAAAALTANQKNRDAVRKVASDAADATEDAAENARRIGAALVTAATESFQRMFSGVGGSGGGESVKSNDAEESELPLTTARSGTGAGASSAGKEGGGGGTKAAAPQGGQSAGGKGARRKSGSADATSGASTGKKGARKKNSGGSSTQAG
jgi:hypothetical protein